MKFVVSIGDFEAQLRRAQRQARADLREAARVATDRATRHAHSHIQRKMKGAGLGRLSNAVGVTTSLRRKGGRWIGGAIYAKGKTNDDNRGAAAIEAYSRGTIIRPKNGGKWLAYQTNAIPRRAGRYRMTPARYRQSGWEQKLGRLEFRPVNARMALLVAKKVLVHPRTGRASRAGPRAPRTRIPQNEVVVFVLIRWTQRAQRFDEKVIALQHAKQVPQFMDDALKEIARRRG